MEETKPTWGLPRTSCLDRVDEVRAMRLTLPLVESDEEGPETEEESLFEDEKVLWQVAQALQRTPATSPKFRAQGVVAMNVGEQVQGERVEELRAAIRQDYEDRVLRDKIWPTRPDRGLHCVGHIELKPGTVPKKQHPIRLSGERHKALCEMVEEWERDGKVEEGQSAWSSPTFVVAKKGGKWRGVVDFRALNEATVTDAHPLPRIEDILVGQGRRHLFSVLDLKDAFHQVPLDLASRPYTCCSTPRGSKQWCVVVMGLKNGVAIFQRVIEHCLKEVADIADPYVDDIIIGTEWQGTEENTLAQHDTDVRRVMDQLARYELVADKKKCQFFVKEVEFCGHILGGGKRRPAPGKLLALEKWEQPKTITALRGFLGFTNYYSTYVKDYAAHAAPLMELLKVNRVDGKKGSKKAVKFGNTETKAFEGLKRELLRGLELQTVNPDRPFVLRVDASDRAVGAALEQLSEPKGGMPTALEATTQPTVPVAFCSRKLTPGQIQTWSPREK
jgi:hypothetical protein